MKTKFAQLSKTTRSGIGLSLFRDILFHFIFGPSCLDERRANLRATSYYYKHHFIFLCVPYCT